jgi:predicted porin
LKGAPARHGRGADVTDVLGTAGMMAPGRATRGHTTRMKTLSSMAAAGRRAARTGAAASLLLLAVSTQAQDAAPTRGAASAPADAASAAPTASAASAASAPDAAPSAAPPPAARVPPAVAASPGGLASRIYGLLDAAAGRFQEPGQQRVLTLRDGAMQHSFVGIRGGDDLGGGLTARFGLESYVRVNEGAAGRVTSADAFWGRTAYAGLHGQFGTSLLGRLPTPLYTLTRQFNPFDESYSFSPAIRQWYGGTLLADARWSNSVGYASPEPEGGAGWSWQLQYNANDNATGSTGPNIGGSLMYASGPLLAGGAFQNVRNSLEVVPDRFDHQRAYEIGMSYELRHLRLYGQIGYVKTAAGNALRTNLYQLGAAAPIGLGFGLLSYGHSRAEANGYASLRRTFSIGYDHFLSKNTDIYALAMNERVTGLSSGNSLAAGVRVRF